MSETQLFQKFALFLFHFVDSCIWLDWVMSRIVLLSRSILILFSCKLVPFSFVSFDDIRVLSCSKIIPFIKILYQNFSRLNKMEWNWRNNQKLKTVLDQYFPIPYSFRNMRPFRNNFLFIHRIRKHISFCPFTKYYMFCSILSKHRSS